MERICRQYILIVDVQADVTATNLFLRHFDGQQFVIGKGHLFHDNHIPIAVSERLARFQNQGRCQFDSLCVGCLASFLSVSFIRISSMSKRMFVLFSMEKSMKK